MPRSIKLQSVPNMASRYVRTFSTFLKKGKGNLPDISVHLENNKISSEEIKAYNKICGFESSSVASASYLHTFIFSAQMHLLSQPEVPFPLPGLIHFANSIKQFRALHIGEEFSVITKLGNLIAHDKGQAFEVLSYIDVSGKRVWEETSVYLFKGKEGIGSVLEWEQPTLPENAIKESWSLYPTMGFDFAKASGDFNPIHLHPLSAKLFGFQSHIIHGMWNVGKILALLGKRMPESFEYTVSFKVPIYLPASIIFRHEKTNNGFNFDVVDKTQEIPHLKGYINKL